MNPNDFLLCLIFGVSACFLAVAVGHEALLYNGATIAKIKEFPYQISVQVVINGYFQHDCGGGIIDDRFILTAAHCVFVRGHIDDALVLVGTDNLNKTVKPAVKIVVKKIFVPKGYNDSDEYSNDDIAVLMLNQTLGLSPLKWHNKYLRKLILPSRRTIDTNYTSRTAVIAGFGYNWMRLIDRVERGNTDGLLRSAEVDILAKCHPDQKVTEKQFCAKVKPYDIYHKRGTCTGDSGGPLVQKGKYVIGILSSSPHGCSEDFVGAIYTRVSYYLDFIKRAMKNKDTHDMYTLELP